MNEHRQAHDRATGVCGSRPQSIGGRFAVGPLCPRDESREGDWRACMSGARQKATRRNGRGASKCPHRERRFRRLPTNSDGAKPPCKCENTCEKRPSRVLGEMPHRAGRVPHESTAMLLMPRLDALVPIQPFLRVSRAEHCGCGRGRATICGHKGRHGAAPPHRAAATLSSHDY